jgi:hypothetical protein
MSSQLDIERFKALLSGPEAEAVTKLRALRDEHQGYMRADTALRIQTIQAEARRMRDVLASIRVDGQHPRCNQAALLSERVLPMIHWRSSYEHFPSFQRTTCAYPSNCDSFDWKAHLDALDAAVNVDEANALSSLASD